MTASECTASAPCCIGPCMANSCLWCSYDAFSLEDYGPQPSQRVATVLVYLTDVKEGGMLSRALSCFLFKEPLAFTPTEIASSCCTTW